jgi:hypothetical protein
MTWYLYLVWVVAAGLLGFLIAAVFSRWLRLPRAWYLIPYVALAGAFARLYFAWSQTLLLELLQNNVIWGVVGAIVIGVFVVKNVLSQPASPHSRGGRLVWDVIWLGGVYGFMDALLLSVIPVLATWQAFSLLGWTAAWPGQIITGIICLVASLLVTAAYHRGYPEYAGKRLMAPVIGNGMMSVGYLITANPITALASHVAMHIAGIFHGPETTTQLPPHYAAETVTRPLV